MSKPFRSSFLISLIALATFLTYQASLEPETYRILIANDDGVDSEGIAALTLAFSELGEVVVCAPPANRSGASHSSSLFSGPQKLTQGKMKGAKEVWILDGSPSDCVTFGLVHLGRDEPFDVVVSGINHGSNVGLIAHYSGTVGAAMEGSLRDVLSLAVSQNTARGKENGYALAAKFSVDFARRLLQENAPRDIAYSINVPKSDPALIEGVLAAPMGGAYLQVPRFEILEEDGESFAKARMRYNLKYPKGSDSEWFAQNYITITPLRIDFTDNTMLKQISSWDLSLSE